MSTWMNELGCVAWLVNENLCMTLFPNNPNPVYFILIA